MINIKNNSADEVVIKDDKGQLKVWRDKKWQDLKEANNQQPERPDKQKTTTIIDTGMEGPFLPPLKPAVKPPDKISSFPQRKYGINKITNKVFDVLHLNLTDENKKRLKNILYSYCRHTRSLLDGLEVMERPISEGGLGFGLVEAERVMAVVKNILEKIDQEGGIIIDEGTFIEENISPLVPPVIKNDSPAKTQEKVIGQLKQKADKPPVNQQIIDRPVIIKPRILPNNNFPKINRPDDESDKKITEVKKKRLILGPVEELASYTLDDFRRLSTDPKVRVKKILEKIELLAEDSITKKAAGIKAWHQSQVYKQYLDIGEESISRNISVDKVIKEKQLKNQEIMAINEFEALSDLSQKLRF